MEIVDVTLTPLQRRTGAAWVPWRDLAAQQRRRGEAVTTLAPGDDVMLRLADDTVCRGWVLRNAFAGEDGAYVILFGDAIGRRAPLSPEHRPQRVPQQSSLPRVQDVEVRVVPTQRAPWGDERRRVNLFL